MNVLILRNTFEDMEVICLQTEAFYSLVDDVYQRLKKEDGRQLDKWIDGDEAMQLLRIKSKTTLQKLRDEGEIRFSQPQRKIILYDRDSIMNFLERNVI